MEIGDFAHVDNSAVLEHIRKNIFMDSIDYMSRFMRAGGMCYHTVDFTDHMGGGKNQLRFPELVWEDEDHYRMDNYTNRIQFPEISKAKELLGYVPEWSFERRIEAAIEWYRENL